MFKTFFLPIESVYSPICKKLKTLFALEDRYSENQKKIKKMKTTALLIKKYC